MSLPILAQFKGDGFYRIQNNSERKRYLSIANRKIDAVNKNALESGKAGNVFALKMIDNPVSDPGSIIYVMKDGDGYTLEAQGMNTSNLTGGLKLKIYTTSKGDWLYGTKSGTSRYLSDSDGTDGYIKVVGSSDRTKSQAYWTLKSIDQTNEYLGITPDITIGDKYYTTLYVSFPFELSDGMKAYYISNDNTAAGGGLAELKEINKKVPAETPVIIECSSQDPANNKIIPLKPNQSPSQISDNKLKGVYFCYIKMSSKDPTKENENQEFTAIKNAVEYDAKTMRVLGLVDGKLGFVSATDDQLVVTNKGKYLPANKAHLIVNASAPKSVELLSPPDYQAGISNVVVDERPSSTKRGIYTLTGIKVREDNTTDNLQKGIYIINGKKITIK